MATSIQSLITADGIPVGGTQSHNYLGDPAQQKFFVLTLTKRAVPYLVLFEDAQMTTIPKNSGGFGTNGQVSFRKFDALWSAADVQATPPPALIEGEPPEAKDLNITEVNTGLKQYGDWIKVSDLAETASVDGVLIHAAEALGEYEGQKLHRVMLFALDATTNAWWGDGTATSDITVTGAMKLTPAVIKKIVRTMKRNNAARFNDGFYHMIVDPYQTFDLMEGNTEFQEIAKYTGGVASSGGPNIITGEVGKFAGVRFKEANELLTGTGAASAKTYHACLYGPNGFGMLDLAGMAVRRIDPRTNRGIAVYSQPVNRPDKTDPLGQLGFVSCKVAFTGIVFDSMQVMKVITAASA